MISVLLHIAGGIALLTWGLHMVESGLMKAWGASLQRFMAVSLTNRFRAFLAGLGVTAILQSSTATGMIASSFAGRGLMLPVTGMAIMLGANVGSTLIVQAFSLDLSWISPVCLVVGMSLFEKGKGTIRKDIGRALIGVGLMLLALTLLVSIMKPAEAAPALRVVLTALTDEPLLNAMIACAMTWAAHSSVPIILFVMSLADAHVIPLSTALAMVLGANIGSALNPYVEAIKHEDSERRRLPTGNLLIRGGCCVLLLFMLNPMSVLLERMSGMEGGAIAQFHTGLNIVIALLFMPALGPVSRLVDFLLPVVSTSHNPDAPRYLDTSANTTPADALSCAMREAMHMSDIVEDMLSQCVPLILNGSREAISQLMRRDNAVDALHEAIKFYVTNVTKNPLSPEEKQRAAVIMSFVINLEHIGDIIDKSLMELAQKRVKSRLTFSDEGVQELLELHRCVVVSFHRVQRLLWSATPQGIDALMRDKKTIRLLEKVAADNHLARLREGRAESVASSSLHLDILRDIRRIHSHICAIVYPLKEVF